MKKILLAALSLFLIISCASEPKEPHVNPAIADSQNYFIDNGMPVREVKEDQEFFFKKCNVDNRSVHPSKTNYDCNEP